MKNKSLLFLIAVVLFIACDDPEVKDPLAGEWTFKSGTAPIRATFTLTADYKVSKSEITYSYPTNLIPSGYGVGYGINDSTSIARITPGQSVGVISFYSNSKLKKYFTSDEDTSEYFLELRGCKHLGVHGVFSVDTIIYRILRQPVDTAYSGSISPADATKN